MKKFFKIASIVLVIAMLASFASCGNKKSGKVKVIEIPLTEEQYAFAVNKEDPELLAQINAFVKEIKENGKLEEVIQMYYAGGEATPIKSAAEDASKDQLVVATNAAFPPFEYYEGDSYYGIDMEIMRLFAEKIGKELVIKNVDFDAVCTQVESGYADIAAAGLTVNPTRAEIVTFSESYYLASQMIITTEEDTTFDACKTAEDVTKILNGYDASKNVGSQRGTTGQFFVEGDEGFGFDGFKVTSKAYDNGALAVQDLINGNIDFVIIDEAPAKMIAESFNSKVA